MWKCLADGLSTGLRGVSCADCADWDGTTADARSARRGTLLAIVISVRFTAPIDAKKLFIPQVVKLSAYAVFRQFFYATVVRSLGLVAVNPGTI